MTCHKTKNISVILISKISNKTKIIGLICPAVFFTEISVFRSSHFWFLVTFEDEVTKIQKYYVKFDYILQGKWKENHATKATKIPKTKRRKYGMNKTLLT